MTRSPAIELDGLYCKLGRFELGPVTATVPRGSVVALIGPNGAGKTTLLDLVMGLGRPARGRIRAVGLSQPKDEVAIKARVAYVNPDLNYATWGTVGRALDFVRGFYPDWNDDRCARLLGAFELGRGDKIATLSFGGRIKLSLVMALAREAELLLLDEPTVGLDVAARRVLFQEILEIVKDDERTVVISSHQLADLERLADHCAIIARGQLIAMAPMDGLLDRYRQVDAIVAGRMPGIAGVRLIARDGDRVRLLIDRDRCPAGALEARGVRPLAEVAMTLEDLFIALTADTLEVAA
jgi:ABC-2 type transport system ATP-binding protein